MKSDRELVKRNLDLQKRGKDFGLMEIPGYGLWSKRKLSAGVSPAFIAHLDATSIFLLPEELDDVDDSVFEELLDDIASQCNDHEPFLGR